MLKSTLLLLLLLFSSETCRCQNQNNRIRLTAYSFDELQDFIDNATGVTGKNFAQAYLDKAKKVGNRAKITQGYKNHIYFEMAYVRKLHYADSMIDAAKKTSTDILASSYVTKGAVYYSNKSYTPALDCYIKANSLIDETDPYLKYKIAYCIAEIKYYMAYYPEAISLLQSCLTYYKKDNPRPYINTLHLIGLCYNKNGQYELCHRTNQIGITEAAKYNEADLLHYFMHSEGINEYFMGHYQMALKHLTGSIAYFAEKGDFANESVASFYFGKCCLKLGRISEGIASLERVHYFFITKRYIRPDQIEAYHLLAGYYKSIHDKDKQQFFTDALVAADGMLDANYKALSTQLHKDYDTAELKKDKKKLRQDINALKENKDGKETQLTIMASAGIIITILASIILHRFYTLRRRFKNASGPSSYGPETSNDNRPANPVTMNEEVRKVLEKRLEKFEGEKKYLSKDMNLVLMAKLLETNTKYVTTLIRECRGKKTPQYLNDLKIDYLVELLSKDKKARYYKHKALATEIGYSTTNSLHKAFLNRVGSTFTDYLQQLQANDG